MRACVICIDLDGVILDFSESYKRGIASLYVFGSPKKGAREALKEFKKRGWKISIYTARPPVLHKDICWLLRFYDIEFDEVVFKKPVADIYVDDRGYYFKSWKQDLNKIIKRMDKVNWLG